MELDFNDDLDSERVIDFANDEPDDDNEHEINESKIKKPKFGSFKTMGLHPGLVKMITKQGFNNPTPIQRKTIPLILAGNDVVAMARTGSGKTAAFLIPMIEKLASHSQTVGVRAIILSPTRELALQTMTVAKKFSRFTDLRYCLLLGGDSMEDQFADLAANPDIIIATPGRLIHHLIEVGLSLKTVQYVVFDEADRLFEMGFAEQMNEVVTKLPESRQTLLFSATLPQQLVDFAKVGLNNPQLVRLDVDTKISEALKVSFLTCRAEEKVAALLYVLKNMIKNDEQTIIFAATRHHCEYLFEVLKHSGYESTIIYGTMDQTARKINLAKFRAGKTPILLVTDVAARGIDIPLLDNVINYDFPPKPKLFVHRVGRVARNGRTGTAFNLVATDELPFMVDLFTFLGKPLLDSVPDGATFSEADVYFGRIPQDAIDVENDLLKEQFSLHVELPSLSEVVTNAYKLYYKTRAKPTTESVKRAKELPNTNIHPLITQKISSQELVKNDFLTGIKNYKAKSTIFEIDRTKTSNSVAAQVMAFKRSVHKTKADREAKKQAQLSDNEDEDEDESISSKRQLEEKITIPPKKQKVFKDEEFYMSHFPQNQRTDIGYELDTRTGLNAPDVAFDIGADDKDTLRTQSRVQKWDRKKKKFIWVSPDVDPNNPKHKRKLQKLGDHIINTEENGKKYEEWKRKYRMEIPRTGERENREASSFYSNHQNRWKYKHKQGMQKAIPVPEGNEEMVTKGGRKIRSELKSKEQIRKQRKLDEKIKNKKKDRENGGRRGGPPGQKGGSFGKPNNSRFGGKRGNTGHKKPRVSFKSKGKGKGRR